jgi:hypothetical protein
VRSKRGHGESLEEALSDLTSALQAYVLAAQDARCVRVYRRSERGEWRDLPDVYQDGDSFELPGLTRAITVAEVYDGILDVAGHSLLR